MTTDTSETADRVKTARRLGLHPYHVGETELTEGEHYDVVAYTDWGDVFVPTVVSWAGSDEVDHLRSYGESVANARDALRAVKN